VPRPLSRKIAIALVTACVVLAVPASIALSLLVSPPQAVQTAGQSLELSAGPPTLTTAGPGTLALFGQSIPTTQQFAGPIRPRLQWAQVTHYDQLLVALREPGGLGQDLREGWSAYFIREVMIAILLAAALAGVTLLLVRREWRLVLTGVVVAAVIAGGIDAVAVSSAANGLNRLSQVQTLDELVGRTPLTVAAAPPKAPTTVASTVVIGDSTAAGAGNPVVAHATPQAAACRRSQDSYAADIAAVNGTTVVNLACTNASIEAGLFGIESINRTIVPAQLATLDAMTGVRTVIVSIGANEMHWAALMELCLVSPQCDDSASSAWFSQALDNFTVDYYDLLQHLATLPGAPQVIVNEYYDPLPAKPVCPGQPDITVAKSTVLLARLTMFNKVLSEGAASFGFAAVDPSFAGHELCTNQSFVQGLGAGAPLHPNAAGELAIALADERPLLNPAPPHPTEDPTPIPTP
jgi:lysophospholipase L1-like esterase